MRFRVTITVPRLGSGITLLVTPLASRTAGPRIRVAVWPPAGLQHWTGALSGIELEADKPRLFIVDPEVMEGADTLGVRFLGLAPQVEHVAA